MTVFESSLIKIWVYQLPFRLVFVRGKPINEYRSSFLIINTGLVKKLPLPQISFPIFSPTAHHHTSRSLKCGGVWVYESAVDLN